MRKKLLFAVSLLALTLNVFSQISNCEASKDSFPTVEIDKLTKDNTVPLYYINSSRVNSSILKTLNPQFIDSIKVDKEEVVIDGTKYYGQVHIKMKKDFKPTFISLMELKRKYAKNANMPTLFIIDNELINDNYSTFLVDEKYLLKIIVDSIDNKDEKLRIEVIRLTTRTVENTKKANEIRIR